MNLELLLGISLAVSTGFDVQSTMRIPNRIEANPIMKPFANSATSLSLASGGIGFGVILGSHKLKQSGAKHWYVPILVGIGLHSVATVKNWRVGQ